MRYFRSVSRRGGLILVIVAVLVAAVSQLPAGSGNEARKGLAADGSVIQATVNGVTFTYTLTTGELAEDARDGLVALINADPDFIADADAPVPPGVFETDDVVYEVLNADSSELLSLMSCETDANFENSGVYFPDGRRYALIRKPTALAGDGSFDLRLDMISAPDVELPYVLPPGGNVADWILAITEALEDLGFTVLDEGTNLRIYKPDDYVISVRFATSDSLFTHTCAGIEGPSPTDPGDIPTLSQYALALLAAVLLLAGLAMIRRKQAAAG
jgi:hypothetical protein